MQHKPTAEQQAIIDFGVNDTRNLIVEARAGAAKTSTLEMLAHAIPDTQTLYLAFNKSVQTEAQERLPSNCKALTLHSLGMRAWIDVCPNRVVPDKGKSGDNLKQAIAQMSNADQRRFYDEDSWDKVREGFGRAKQCGYVPDLAGFKSARPLCDDAEFFRNRLDFAPSDLEEYVIREAMVISIRLALQGNIDFDDMIYMPTIFQAHFQRYPLVLVDEAQDLSMIQHKMLWKLAKKSRLIAVGDPCQAIYGFRGAHQDSMNELREMFEMETLYLTTSFRCPRTIVELARDRAPDMTYPEWAIEGSINAKGTWSPEDLEDGVAVICRNNAPLISLAFKLIAAGKYPKMANRDQIKTLARKLSKLGDKDVRREQALVNLKEWEKKELKKAKYKQSVRDAASCMKIFLKRCETIGDAIAEATTLANREGRIHLMTGHKSKGLEFIDVFFLDRDLVNMNDEQDFNLWYVIVTRTKNTLTYINSADLPTEEEEEEASGMATQSD